MTPTFRRATLADAPALAELAERIFRDTFGADNRPEDLALHLATVYGVPQQTREIGDPTMITLVVEHAGVLIAFAQLRRGEVPACITGPAPLELQRFYVGHEWHGRGVAQGLMREVLETSRAVGALTLWLGVWERNTRAIAFYNKSGYTDVGTHTFLLGADPQTDRIMVRTLHTEHQRESHAPGESPPCGRPA